MKRILTRCPPAVLAALAPAVLAQENALGRSVDPRNQSVARRTHEVVVRSPLRLSHPLRLYAIPGVWNHKPVGEFGDGSEWLMAIGQLPVADYAKLAPQFNPTQFNANKWPELARCAGMKYVVITSSWPDYRMAPLDGTLILTPGTHVVRLVALNKPNSGVMKLRRITLAPPPYSYFERGLASKKDSVACNEVFFFFSKIAR